MVELSNGLLNICKLTIQRIKMSLISKKKQYDGNKLGLYLDYVIKNLVCLDNDQLGNLLYQVSHLHHERQLELYKNYKSEMYQIFNKKKEGDEDE